MTSETAERLEQTRQYIRENFRLDDRLAVVTLPRKGGSGGCQRIAPAERIVSDEFQAWLRYQNAHKLGVYISMNPLRPEATGRTKDDVKEIRHVYLEFDENGPAAREALLGRNDIPKPNDILTSSPERFQMIWRVEGFSKEQAEELMRGMSRATGADVAATDCSRVLRLPGFSNQKLDQLHWIPREHLHDRVFRPEHFPQFEPVQIERLERSLTRNAAGQDRSQSAKDYGFARRAYERGELPAEIEAKLAGYRTDKGRDAARYARVTVRNAVQKGGAFSRSRETDSRGR